MMMIIINIFTIVIVVTIILIIMTTFVDIYGFVKMLYYIFKKAKLVKSFKNQ